MVTSNLHFSAFYTPYYTISSMEQFKSTELHF